MSPAAQDPENVATLSLALAAETARGVEREYLFQLLVGSVRDYAIFMLDPSGRVATWNLGAERIKGYRAEEITGRHFSAFYPEVDVRSGKCEHVLEVARREGHYEEEGWRVRKDGNRFWAHVVISAVRDGDGRLVGFSKVTRDLTDRKRAVDEQAARLEAEERFRLLIDSVRDYAIFMLDATGHVATWNVGAERIKGYRAEEIIGSHFSKFYPEEDVQAGKCELELAGATRDGRFEDEGWRVRKDGSRFWANVVINAVRDRNGNLIGFAKVTRDLTIRRQAEEERAARLAAEQANQTKDEFLAMLSHELRNPLAPILTAVQLLKLRGDSSPVKEHEIIERQVTHMMTLVDDLLDVARLSRGKLELKPRHLDLRGVLAKAIEIASPLLEQRGHQFKLDVPAQPLGVHGDEARLTQVFANILTNAAKYTDPDGHITATVTQDSGQIVVAVSDDGIGIDAELLPRIFKLFVQGHRAAEHAPSGLGIGLTLVHELVQMHGGTVTAHSAGPGRGSTFTVRLPHVPLAVVDEHIARRPSRLTATVNPRRVLIVDDNEDALMLLAEALKIVGHDVRTASDPEAALALVEEFRPDFAILDIGLPMMDGYELGTKIREQLAGETRLFALTGYGQDADRRRSAAAGFEAHFVKPVNVKQLLESIARN